MSERNPDLDGSFAKERPWKAEMEMLRAILLATPLTEERKWGKPCYTFGDGNVAILFRLKACCGIGFFKGALLKDPEGILHRQGENSQAVRMIRATTVDEIEGLRDTITAYVAEAIAIEKSGQKVDFSEKDNLVFPEELLRAFADDPKLKQAFEALTPGRQRAYNLHFSSARQSQTRASRIEKCTPRILDGKGLNDR